MRGEEVGRLFLVLFQATSAFLRRLNREELISLVENKNYFSFSIQKRGRTRLSRPINSGLFLVDSSQVETCWESLLEDDLAGRDADAVTKVIYTLAISFCAGVDMVKDGDKKTPGTFFEYLIGYLFAKALGIDPVRRIQVLNLDLTASLPTDYIFNLGSNRPKFHVPVKTSTRERIIQVWAHQRVLDGVYGTGRFLGMPVVLNETKLDVANRKVTEICLPEQWLIYQMHIAKLNRIYYLDVPESYGRLNLVFPPIRILPFGQFFFEFAELT